MRISELFAALVLASTAASTGGCYGESSSYTVTESPPAPREEVVTYRPGYVWVQGHWNRPYRNHRWAWVGGYYERERPGYVYENGQWERRGRGYVWINGTWRHQGVVRR